VKDDPQLAIPSLVKLPCPIHRHHLAILVDDEAGSIPGFTLWSGNGNSVGGEAGVGCGGIEESWSGMGSCGFDGPAIEHLMAVKGEIELLFQRFLEQGLRAELFLKPNGHQGTAAV